jgi:hypothetical protein
MTFAFLFSALLHVFTGNLLHLDAQPALRAAPADTSGVITGARERRMRPDDTSGVITGKVQRAKAMDTSGVITG